LRTAEAYAAIKTVETRKKWLPSSAELITRELSDEEMAAVTAAE